MTERVRDEIRYWSNLLSWGIDPEQILAAANDDPELRRSLEKWEERLKQREEGGQ